MFNYMSNQWCGLASGYILHKLQTFDIYWYIMVATFTKKHNNFLKK